MHANGEVENLIRSLSRFSGKIMLILSAQDNPEVQAMEKTIGPAIILEQLWKKREIGNIIRNHLKERKFEFDVERAPSFLRFFITCSYPAPTRYEHKKDFFSLRSLGMTGHNKSQTMISINNLCSFLSKNELVF